MEGEVDEDACESREEVAEGATGTEDLAGTDLTGVGGLALLVVDELVARGADEVAGVALMVSSAFGTAMEGKRGLKGVGVREARREILLAFVGVVMRWPSDEVDNAGMSSVATLEGVGEAEVRARELTLAPLRDVA